MQRAQAAGDRVHGIHPVKEDDGQDGLIALGARQMRRRAPGAVLVPTDCTLERVDTMGKRLDFMEGMEVELQLTDHRAARHLEVEQHVAVAVSLGSW